MQAGEEGLTLFLLDQPHEPTRTQHSDIQLQSFWPQGSSVLGLALVSLLVYLSSRLAARCSFASVRLCDFLDRCDCMLLATGTLIPRRPGHDVRHPADARDQLP